MNVTRVPPFTLAVQHCAEEEGPGEIPSVLAHGGGEPPLVLASVLPSLTLPMGSPVADMDVLAVA